jgi:hypothetical protein
LPAICKRITKCGRANTLRGDHLERFAVWFAGTSSSSVVTCGMWGWVSCSCGPGKPAAAGGRGAQATRRGPNRRGARPAAHHRLADRATLEREVRAWQVARNRAGRGVNWRFTTEDARIKLKHLYPTTQN